MTKWNEIERIFGAMDLLRNKIERRGYVPAWNVLDMPKTNLYDLGERLEIRAELPGLSKGDINVKIQGNYLEISGTRKSDAPQGYSLHRTEREASSFSRSFTLPSDVDADKAEASLENGILTVALPKLEAAKPKKIAVR